MLDVKVWVVLGFRRPGRDLGSRGLPAGDGVQLHDQLAHDGYQSHFASLAALTQTLVKPPEFPRSGSQSGQPFTRPGARRRVRL